MLSMLLLENTGRQMFVRQLVCMADMKNVVTAYSYQCSEKNALKSMYENLSNREEVK